MYIYPGMYIYNIGGIPLPHHPYTAFRLQQPPPPHLYVLVEQGPVTDDEPADEEDDRVGHVRRHGPERVHRLLHPGGDAAPRVEGHHKPRRHHRQHARNFQLYVGEEEKQETKNTHKTQKKAERSEANAQ